jgi:hypothetical protein
MIDYLIANCGFLKKKAELFVRVDTKADHEWANRTKVPKTSGVR